MGPEVAKGIQSGSDSAQVFGSQYVPPLFRKILLILQVSNKLFLAYEMNEWYIPV